MDFKMFKCFVLFSVIAVTLAFETLSSDEEEWTKFKIKYNRNYQTPEEESHRFDIFKNNLQNIREHNAKFERGEVTYYKGVNDFTDLTAEEFASKMNLGDNQRQLQ